MATVFDRIPEVSFIDNLTLEQEIAFEIADFQTAYKEETGKTLLLPPASPWRLLLLTNSHRQYQLHLCVDHAGKMNMLKYAEGEFLDNYALAFGMTRSEGTAATTTVRFTLSAAQASVIAIPKGTRVSNSNGVYFSTDEYAEIAAGSLTADVACSCTEIGSAYNEIAAGELTTLVDRIGYVSAVSNLTDAQGGSDRETDDEFRMRIYNAKSEWNTAGSEEAYRYRALSYSVLIEDVYVMCPDPGTVRLYVLLKSRETPDAAFLDGLKEYLSEEDKRPLSDTLEVVAAEQETFNIAFTYYINYSERAQASAIQAQVQAAVEAYEEWQTSVIGRDIIPDYLVRLVMAAGAKRMVMNAPVFEAIPDGTIPKVGTVSVIYGGVEND